MIRRILGCGPAATAISSLVLAAACGGAASQASLRHMQSESGVVARIGEREITLAQVDERARPSNMNAYQALYDARRSAIEEMIDEALLELEARSRGVTTDELVSREIESKIAEVTEEDVQAFYVQNQARLHGQTLEQIGGQIREFLVARNEASARESFLGDLRAETAVAVSLEPPRVPLEVERGERIKGPWDAPVTIVEYSDFQCPFCARVGPTLARIEGTYGDKIKLVYRDFPLPNHPEAQSAAEAARCAHEQGKFWPYHDRLFDTERSLSAETYRSLAAEVGLDARAFDECVASGRFREAIQEGYRNGESIGVGATPAFFINGRHLSGAQPFEAFQKIIELKRIAASELPRTLALRLSPSHRLLSALPDLRTLRNESVFRGTDPSERIERCGSADPVGFVATRTKGE